MAVGEEDGVDAPDVVRQRLRAQIGPGVDQQPAVVVGGDEDRRPQPLVAGIGRRQVAQSHPIIGTPCEVPVPRNVIFTSDAGEDGDLASVTDG